MEKYLNFLMSEETVNNVLSYGLRILYALLVLWIGLRVIKLIVRLMGAGVERSLKDASISGFVIRIISTILKIVLGLTIASMLGIETTSFLAILGSIGLAIGLALQGSLANFAGGILILLFKPFKQGDYVVIKGNEGFVYKIDLLHTTLRTRNNQIIIIPNGILTNDVVTNYYYHNTVRKVFYVTVPYNADVDKALAVVLQALKDTPVVLEDPAPGVEVAELGEYGIKIRCLAWTVPAKYFGTNEPSFLNIKKALDQAGIHIAVPQRIIHMHSNES